MENQQIIKQIEQDFSKRKSLFKHLNLENYASQEKLYAKYILAYLMDCDLHIQQDTLDDFVYNSSAVEGAFEQEIPLQIFLDYVVQPRINNERLDPTRHFFRKQVEKVVSSNLKETIFNVNYWTIEKLQYQATDARTQYAFLSYLNGLGRCGEKSTFLVHIYRSLGIPARQVYAPWWTHSDDRHAWVEVYFQGKWRYLGAGSAEEIFDWAWFTLPAHRALIIQSNQFSHLPTKEKILEDHGIYKKINVTSHYTSTRQVTIFTNIPKIQMISLGVINYGRYRKVVEKKVEKGRCIFDIGGGDVLVHAYDGEKHYYKMLLENDREIELTKADALRQGERFHYVQKPPQAPVLISPETQQMQEEKASRKEKHLEKYRLRQAKIQAEKQNKTAYQKLKKHPAFKIYQHLNNKDRFDFDAEMLINYYALVQKYKNVYPSSVYQTMLLNPRLSFEDFIYDVEKLSKFPMDDIDDIYNLIMREIDEESDGFVPDRIMPYDILLKHRKGTYYDKLHLVAAIAKVKGIPSQLGDLSGTVEIFENDQIRPLGVTSQHLLKFEGEAFEAMTIAVVRDVPQLEIGHQIIKQKSLFLPEDYYQIFISKRLPNGVVIGSIESLCLDEPKQVSVSPLSVSLEDLMENVAIEDLLQTYHEPTGLITFLKPEEEPSQHVINELIQKASIFNQESIPIYLYVSGDINHRMIEQLKQHLSTLHLIENWSSNWEETLIRRHFKEPKNYPFTVIYREKKSLLSSSGYQVGFIDNNYLDGLFK